jgi:hypothetical protein
MTLPITRAGAREVRPGNLRTQNAHTEHRAALVTRPEPSDGSFVPFAFGTKLVLPGGHSRTVRIQRDPRSLSDYPPHSPAIARPGVVHLDDEELTILANQHRQPDSAGDRDHSTKVKRWRDGQMALRWCAAGMIEATSSSVVSTSCTYGRCEAYSTVTSPPGLSHPHPKMNT